jgi:hypothetical protein
MFGLWERKGKSGEPLPEANDGPPDSHRPLACARAAISNRASMQRAICLSHSTVEGPTRPRVSLTRPSMSVPPASFADTAAKDSSSWKLNGWATRLLDLLNSIVSRLQPVPRMSTPPA